MTPDELKRLRALCANGIDCGDNSCRFIRERSGNANKRRVPLCAG